jgi:DNA adenine methylase
LFYCDPPYYETEGYYANVGEAGFTKERHIRLRDTLLGISGKFLLSYNDCPFIREIYGAPGIQIKTVSRPNSIKLRYDAGAMFDELLIANYDMDERRRLMPTQLNLFGEDGFSFEQF